MNRTRSYRRGVVRRLIACVAITLVCLMTRGAVAAPEDEVRAAFDRFVAAQNAHDIKEAESLLLASADFLWITRGAPVWGSEAAIKRFATLYEGTWQLDPETAGLKITMVGDGVAQLYVPIMFTIGASGQPPQRTRFLMNQVLVKTAAGWKVSRLLPIMAAPQ
jgi:ketosteroid isomerase-like protein